MSELKRFVEDKYEELRYSSSENYSSLTIRLQPKDALMIKGISKALNFPISASFTKIISEAVYEIACELEEEDLEHIVKIIGEREPYWFSRMYKEGLIDSSLGLIEF